MRKSVDTVIEEESETLEEYDLLLTKLDFYKAKQEREKKNEQLQAAAALEKEEEEEEQRRQEYVAQKEEEEKELSAKHAQSKALIKEMYKSAGKDSVTKVLGNLHGKKF